METLQLQMKARKKAFRRFVRKARLVNFPQAEELRTVKSLYSCTNVTGSDFAEVTSKLEVKEKPTKSRRLLQ